MKITRTAFGNSRDIAAGAVSVLSLKIIGQHFHFGNGINIRSQIIGSVLSGVGKIHTIKIQVNRRCACAIDGNTTRR